MKSGGERERGREGEKVRRGLGEEKFSVIRGSKS